jgi:hypothetical protein
VDAVTSERLIELRTLLLEALARTGTGAHPGRHATLVRLDGVRARHDPGCSILEGIISLVQAAKHLVMPSPLTL